jgi:putative tricarboxylic transport membrane protein
MRTSALSRFGLLASVCVLTLAAISPTTVNAATKKKSTTKKPATTKAAVTTKPATTTPAAAATTVAAASVIDTSKFNEKSLRIMAPAAPGGGWDQTSRALQRAMQSSKIRNKVEVFNVPGAGGTIGLSQLISNETGKGDILMTMGLVMVGAIETNRPPATLDKRFVLPIARLTAEDEIIVVPANSKYLTIKDLMKDLESDPGSVSIAGGSAGGTDHILHGLMAKEVGVEGKRINYVPFSGGGAALAALLGNKVSAGISGYGEFAAQIKEGKLRALASSGEKKLPGTTIPTLKESGYDIELINWRGLVAPQGLSPAELKELQDTVAATYATKAWKDELAKNGWDDTYLAGEPFRKFLDAEEQRIRTVLKSIGLV